MKLATKLTTAIAVAAIGATPLAMAGGALASSSPSHANSASTNAKRYGKVCAAENALKTHTASQKGTPFSKCVTAMAQLANGTTTSPAKACATESKKAVAGQKGTPYSDCVAAGAKVLASKH